MKNILSSWLGLVILIGLFALGGLLTGKSQYQFGRDFFGSCGNLSEASCPMPKPTRLPYCDPCGMSQRPCLPVKYPRDAVFNCPAQLQ